MSEVGFRDGGYGAWVGLGSCIVRNGCTVGCRNMRVAWEKMRMRT